MKDPVASAYETQMAEMTKENAELARALREAMRKITTYENCLTAAEAALRTARLNTR